MTRARSNPVLGPLLRGMGVIVLPVLALLTRALRRLNAAVHRAQAIAQAALGGERNWYDHQVDVNWNWPRTGRWEPLARGVLSGIAIREGARVLDVCSGDGFFARQFYAPRAGEVIGIDQDPRAVAHASRVNGAPNLSFKRGDIRSELPDGPFDNVVWDAGISYLTRPDTVVTLRGIRERLAPDGLLSGYTDRDPVNPPAEVDVFGDSGELARCLGEVFPHVCVFEFFTGTRQMFQFYAATEESSIPVSDAHAGAIWISTPEPPGGPPRE